MPHGGWGKGRGGERAPNFFALSAASRVHDLKLAVDWDMLCVAMMPVKCPMLACANILFKYMLSLLLV